MFESITFVGNSHLDQFKLHTFRLPLKQNIIALPGASIRGLINPNSSTGINKLILHYDSPTNIFVFHLGQVDIEFGYFYKSAMTGQKLNKDTYLGDMISIYKEFLHKLQSRIIVIGVNPCVIRDIQHIFRVNFKDTVCHANNLLQETGCFNLGADFNLYKHIYDESQDQITEYLKKTNNAIKQLCLDKNYIFYDVWSITTDSTTGNIKNEFIPSNIDHHLVPSDTLSQDLTKFILSKMF